MQKLRTYILKTNVKLLKEKVVVVDCGLQSLHDLPRVIILTLLTTALEKPGKTTLYDKLQFFEQLTSVALNASMTSNPMPEAMPLLMSGYPTVLSCCCWTPWS